MAIKEVKKHNATTRSTPPSKWVVNAHDTDPQHDEEPTENPTSDPNPPKSPVDNDLAHNEPCEPFTLDDSTLEHLMDAYSPPLLYQQNTSMMCLNTLPPIMCLSLIGEAMVDLLAQM